MENIIGGYTFKKGESMGEEGKNYITLDADSPLMKALEGKWDAQEQLREIISKLLMPIE